MTQSLQYSEKLNRLGKKAVSWRENDTERITAAKKVLEVLEGSNWGEGKEWLAKTVELETNFELGTSEARSYASSNRYIFGTMIQSFLKNYVNRRDQDKQKVLEEGGIVSGYPGVSFEIRTTNKTIQQAGTDGEKICIVLGAGNQNFLTAIDVLNRVFLHKECVLIKHHPLRPWLSEPFEQIFDPLIQLHVVDQVLDDGVEFTQALIKSPQVGHVHLTGAEATYRAIQSTVASDVSISAELGCVTPWLIVPNLWTKKEILNAAKQLAAAKLANGGANCLSPQVLLVAEQWSQKEEFLDCLQKQFLSLPTPRAYYPGSRQRRDQVLEEYNQAPLGPDSDQVALINLGSRNEISNSQVLQNEVFGPLLAIVEIEGGGIHDDASEWLLEKAVPYVNSEAIAGSLSLTLLSPASSKTAAIQSALESLQYGSVCHNLWSVVGYISAQSGGSWGAHPFAADADKSGKGYIGNIFDIQPTLEKTIVKGGTVAKPVIDFSQQVPGFVFDALYVGMLRKDGSALRRLTSLFASRIKTTILRRPATFRVALPPPS
uniref:Aldehyde dehydrogenase domain-containing protein n=1 Tax=Aureoumbra lagunensis TaxID=44058 RepID=A0A7S3K617_9STRA|mmetsp:Transcript_9014/g.13871  ORF Transcript_9014/g.13871 Transcript_9014/m.13871 type:complete len:545 (-) Transcript_9014:174-1808(-)|eukprot:CAMPEP_0197311188 /NCGR_PEP_ID=MMETSP0891-20130614/9689_1 /TAXON_ID=44058 ORGANISM="Aureoumbra lagunensis, Strain CCMP1510" /NCGR_SAMPLE_ID=MMETSP0891 /ASSEMBLY_ACC=CAM_ASM_000534 /LENGTH=544 /DNA_ID=CAMNT_0042797171 /DNA_START=47 /DNA_END=1681 /DNA_ORIENTATION=-